MCGRIVIPVCLWITGEKEKHIINVTELKHFSFLLRIILISQQEHIYAIL